MANQFKKDNPVFITASPPAQPEDIRVMEFYAVDWFSPYGWWGIELSFFVAFFGLAFLALTYVKHIKR